jgi:hypothetical protein
MRAGSVRTCPNGQLPTLSGQSQTGWTYGRVLTRWESSRSLARERPESGGLLPALRVRLRGHLLQFAEELVDDPALQGRVGK